MNPDSLLKVTKIILSLKSKVKCPICLDFVENAVQLGCSHQFCNSCLQEHRLQNLPLCPVCKSPINKRTAIYKDYFADELSKFVNRACQLIKETYACEVDELNINEHKLQEIINTAPQDVCLFPTTSKISKTPDFKKPAETVFDKLRSQPRCYVNKKRQIEQREKPKVLNFIDGDTRTKILDWLNDNQQKLDTLTQTPSILTFSDDEADFELPSISQVPFHRKQKLSNRVRSQSLNLGNNLNEPLLKRYRSLTQGLDDDYDIEEVHSETLVKQVERKVIQDMLEDECLANMEHLAEQSKDKSKNEKATPKKGRKSVSKNKESSSISNSEPSSGWDRIKDVKKSIKKAAKEPKKLNISLQETSNIKESHNGGTKKSSIQKTVTKVQKLQKASARESPVAKAAVKTKKSPKASTTADNKENENFNKEVDTKVDAPKDQPINVFNLSAVENYFEKNMTTIKVTPDQNTSSDMEIDIINDSATKLKESNLQNRNSTDKQNTSAKEKSFDDDIFLLPTQVTPQSLNRNNTLCYVAPVSKEFTDIDIIAVCLTNNLQCCISSATDLKNDVAHSLVECFTNLKTYIDKILKHRSEKKEQEMQIKPGIKKTTATQTDTVDAACTAVQTTSTPVKKLMTKKIQTSQYHLENAEVQTDVAVYVDQEVQAVEHLPARRITKERSVERIIKHSIHYSVSPTGSLKEGSNNKNVTKVCKHKRSSTQTSMVEKLEGKEKETSTKSSESSNLDNQEHRISVDSSKPSKSKSRNISQESLLICSLGPTASNQSEKKINRKLIYGEEEQRSFKRIRKPASDSESDEEGMPIKRRLVRDDLTVEFVDTERGSKDDSQNKRATPESEKMDYDKYLLEVMAKYGTPPPAKVSGNEDQFKNGIESNSKLLSNKKRDSQEPSNSQNSESQKSKKKSQKGSGDHIFTAHIAFEDNLDKFDKEIFEYEHAAKTHSTEYDLVENTPILSPKSKIPRLQPSSKKKDSLKEPLKILSKGSASGNNTSKRKEPFDEDSLSNLTQQDPSTLNKNIDIVPSQTEKCTDDVAGILEDLQNDDDFFKSNMEYDENEQENNLQQRQTKHSDTDGQLTMADLQNNENAEKDVLNVTQENIDKVVDNLNGFEDDDDIDAELEKISFTAEQRKLREAAKIKILQNIKLKSQDRPAAKSPFNGVIEGSDASDEEIVETTPQKRKHTFRDMSLDAFEALENNSLGIDFCLPPPPGFGDEDKATPVPDDATRESPKNNKNAMPFEGNKSSLTPDSLSQFIVTPDTMMYREKAAATQNDNSQQSLTFKPSFVTPNKPVKGKGTLAHSTPRVSQILAADEEDAFSPITKSTIKFSQTKYTPLVSTSRLSTKKLTLMTSTPNQKSILNYVRPSQDSPSSFQQRPKPCIMWSRIVNKDLNVFTQLEIKKLVTTATSFNPRVTHLIVLVDEKGQIVSHTAKILVAIAAGIWVVRYEWAQDCLKMNRIVPEEPYEALDSTGVPGPQISRLTRDTKPLFRDFRFYCAPPLLTISKGDLQNILQLSGGEIARNLDDFLQKDGKVNIILTESAASEDTEQFENLLQVYKAVTIDVEWLTTCIGQYKLVSFRAFLVSGDDSNICDLGYPPTLVESVPFTLTEAM